MMKYQIFFLLFLCVITIPFYGEGSGEVGNKADNRPFIFGSVNKQYEEGESFLGTSDDFSITQKFTEVSIFVDYNDRIHITVKPPL